MDRATSHDLIAIAQIAARRHGNITHAQLRACGLDDDAIAHRVRTGLLYRVHRGVYALGRPPTTPLQRASAAVLACGPTAALSHGSAMCLWGFWKHRDTPFEVILTRHPVPGGYTADAYFPDHKLIVEIDSHDDHDNPISFDPRVPKGRR